MGRWSARASVSSFGHSSFGFDSSFEFRHSSFEKTPSPRPLPQSTGGEGVGARSFGVPQDDMGRVPAQGNAPRFVIQTFGLRHGFVMGTWSFPRRLRYLP